MRIPKDSGKVYVKEGLSNSELAIYSNLKHQHGYGFTRLHARIIVAIRRGKSTIQEVAKFVNQPVKEVIEAYDELVDRKVLKSSDAESQES